MSAWPAVNLLYIVYRAVFSIAAILLYDRAENMSLQYLQSFYEGDN